MKYWGNQEEQAIIKFNSTESINEKHVVYVKVIQPAFRKLVENIYYTYNFNKTLYDFDTIVHEATTHLYEKLSKYNVEKNKKSYSYFGTIVKNWLIQQSNSYKKRVFIDEDDNDLIISDLSYYKFNEINNIEDGVEFIYYIKERLNDNIEDNNFSKEDKLVLSILVQIINDHNKFYINNKKQLYVYIKEATNLPSRKITKSLNKIRIKYTEIRKEFID